MNDSYTIRQFTPEDLSAYKALRLEALQVEHGTFGNGYEMESKFTDEQWLARLTNPASAIFGLYHGEKLIGITGINVRETDKPGDAYMTHSYIKKEYRGRKLSRMLYEIRFAWAKEYGIKRLIIGHKKSNLASQAANQHFGFKYTHSNPRTWADGSVEDDMQYELWL
jgi:RimJ/RimL family protein N-acetyltransferase